MPPLEGNGEVIGRKQLEMVILNKLLTRLPTLLAQMKAGNNSCKLKYKIRQIRKILFTLSVQ